MMVFWVLWSCGGAEPVSRWSVAPGLAPVLVHMDADGDGAVGEAEYLRHAWRAPEFGTVDGDQNAVLSTEELHRLLRSEDVQRFDDRDVRRPVDPDVWSQPFSDPSGERLIWELLCFLDEELQFGNARYQSPAYEVMVRAAGTATLDSTEVSALLSHFESAYDERGWTFPEHLVVEREGD